MTKVFLLFHRVRNQEFVEAVYSEEHEEQARAEAERRAKKTRHHFDVEVWEVK